MQQKKIKTGTVLLLIIIGICWTGGLLMAGSESAYMPWVNLTGLMINGAAGYFMCRMPGLKYIIEC